MNYRKVISSLEDLKHAANWMKAHAIEFTEDKPKELVIAEYEQGRSQAQNRYLNGWVYPELVKVLAEAGHVIACDDGTEIPYTRDILHEHTFARRFRVQSSWTVSGQKFYQFESTAKMKKARFTEYIEQIECFSYQYWSVTIPHPSDGYWESIMQEALN